VLATPGFHHIMLNVVDPERAIGWYTRQFACTSKGEWAGYPALFSDNDVKVLFNKVDKPAPQLPQSAIWHFGWHVPDTQKTIAEFKARPEVKLLPLYTEETSG
jgi:catechol 2,3-dioxygenase-like lactoylglutathione lyase family enzyme